jgi:cation diffusion facilitator CzcD-associated flavoprotein CzcO
LGSAFARFSRHFSGKSIHSHQYIDPTTPLELTGQRILVVGIGNSAADITVELSSKALRNQVTLSTQSSAWLVPVYIAGRPGGMFWRTSPYLPLTWQRRAVQLIAPMLGTDPTM